MQTTGVYTFKGLGRELSLWEADEKCEALLLCKLKYCIFLKIHTSRRTIPNTLEQESTWCKGNWKDDEGRSKEKE